jgi:predicted ATPase
MGFAASRHYLLKSFSVFRSSTTYAREARMPLPQPWGRIPHAARLQRRRTLGFGSCQFYDRSPICTLALAKWLEHPISDALRFEIERIRRENVYRPEVFFVRSLGFMTPTEARRIGLADSIRFGELHEETYLAHGFKLIYLDRAGALQRVKSIKLNLGNFQQSGCEGRGGSV